MHRRASTESELFLQLRKCHHARRFNEAQEMQEIAQLYK